MEQSFTVATFNTHPPADLLAKRLREAGFKADVFDESGEQKWLLLNLEPKAHLRVRVPKEEADRALQALKDWDAADGAMGEAVRCPQCGSSRIEYPQFSRRTLMSALPAAAAAAGLIERQYYCEACGNTWDADPKPAPDLDVLNWPKTSKFP
jgi:DNA-directed RNA polymerase subunit M/transcription elongation factor TFIIS